LEFFGRELGVHGHNLGLLFLNLFLRHSLVQLVQLHVLLPFFILLSSLIFAQHLLLLFLGLDLLLTLSLFLFLLLDRVALSLLGDQVLQISDLFLQAVHFDAESVQIFVDLESLLILLLPLESVSKSQVGIHVLLVLEDAELEGLDGLVILTADIEKDARVVQDHRVRRVQVDRLPVEVQGLLESSGAFHINAHVLEDSGFAGVLLGSFHIVAVCLIAFAFFLEDDGEVDLRFVVVRLQFDDL